MVKAKSVALSKILKNNQRLCLSAKRALGRCFECSSYGGRYIYIREDKKIFVKPCESRIENIAYNLLEEGKAKLHAKIEQINEKIKGV